MATEKNTANANGLTMDKLVSLCKRRGFVFQSSEIYGGLASAWDYGPLGVELKNRIQRFWWREMTQLHDNIVGLDAAILMHPRVWEASGHVENFTDPLVDCRNCRQRFRADQLTAEQLASKKCPACGSGPLTEPRMFNLMFRTHLGPVEDAASQVYLRPETAQGIYVNFRNVQQSSRVKVPFGIAQVGKAFRNEITTKNFIFRTCEFEQLEMQFFIHPSEDEKWFEHWKAARLAYYAKLGIRPEKLRFKEHGPDELAHYAKKAFDVQFEFPFGWQEIEGIHNRTDYDLRRHMEFSGKDLTYLDEVTKERFTPYIIETSAGLTRTVLLALCDAYDEDVAGTAAGGGEAGEETRVVLRLHPAIAPDHGGRVPAGEEGRAGGAGPRDRAGAARGLHHLLRPQRGHRPPLPPPGRGGHPLLSHHRRADQGGRHGDPALPRLDGAGARAPQRAARPHPPGDGRVQEEG